MATWKHEIMVTFWPKNASCELSFAATFLFPRPTVMLSDPTLKEWDAPSHSCSVAHAGEGVAVDSRRAGGQEDTQWGVLGLSPSLCYSPPQGGTFIPCRMLMHGPTPLLKSSNPTAPRTMGAGDWPPHSLVIDCDLPGRCSEPQTLPRLSWYARSLSSIYLCIYTA